MVNGDFQRTLDLACAMGFDADNQAATVAGLLGVINGMKGLPANLYLPVEGWTQPFNNRYINITVRLPDADISSIIDKTLDAAIKTILLKGGKTDRQTRQTGALYQNGALFNPPLEFAVGPLPHLEVGKPVDFNFYTQATRIYDWSLVSEISLKD
jgi:hypothetical protein